MNRAAADIATRLSGFSERTSQVRARLHAIRPPRLRVVALALAVLFACYAGYMWWVRDWGVFQVEHVTVTGLEGKEAPAIRRALRQAGTRMTTLHVRQDELERAVDSFAVVRSVTASADFPRTLKITVNEYEPVAALVARDGRRAAISRAQTILRSVTAQTALPTIDVGTIPTSGSLEDSIARRLVTVLAAAPSQLRRLIERAYLTGQGLRISMREGPVLYFGHDKRVAAKWAAVSRVLADEASAGAKFIDVRLPERPVAGGFDPDSGSTGGQAGTNNGQL